MFPKKIGQQRRDVINIQQLIHLNSNAMKTISGSTNQNNCHRWKKYLYLVIDYRDPVCTRQCLGIHGASQCKIRYLMQNVLLHKNNFFPMGAHRFIWCHIQSNNFKNFLLIKVAERASKVKSKTCDFVSRRRLLLLQRPSKCRKAQKASTIFIYYNETLFNGSVT